MAAQRHTTALVVGLVLGGLTGAAVTLWKTPRSGAQLRALMAERAEDVLFRVMRMDEAQTWGTTGGTSPVTPAQAARAAAETQPLPVVPRETAMNVPIAPDTHDDIATLPATFRGEVLTEQPTDIVLDGPRPAPADR